MLHINDCYNVLTNVEATIAENGTTVSSIYKCAPNQPTTMVLCKPRSDFALTYHFLVPPSLQLMENVGTIWKRLDSVELKLPSTDSRNKLIDDNCLYSVRIHQVEDLLRPPSMNAHGGRMCRDGDLGYCQVGAALSTVTRLPESLPGQGR